MRKIVLSCFVLMQTLLVFAQERGKITVVIVNDRQAAMENATVELLKAKDSSLVKAAVTDADLIYLPRRPICDCPPLLYCLKQLLLCVK